MALLLLSSISTVQTTPPHTLVTNCSPGDKANAPAKIAIVHHTLPPHVSRTYALRTKAAQTPRDYAMSGEGAAWEVVLTALETRSTSAATSLRLTFGRLDPSQHSLKSLMLSKARRRFLWALFSSSVPNLRSVRKGAKVAQQGRYERKHQKHPSTH